MQLTASVVSVGVHAINQGIIVGNIVSVTQQIVSKFNTGVSGQKVGGAWCDWRVQPTPQPPHQLPLDAGPSQLTLAITTDDNPQTISIVYTYDCLLVEYQDQGVLKVVNFFEQQTQNWWTWKFET
jgi:hypothetical protein